MDTLQHMGREIHRRYDEFGPILVFDDGNKRYLSFGTADEQSCQLKQAPFQLQHEYARCMAAVLLQFDDWQRALSITLLGTGGGTLATTLHQLLPQACIRAVDIRAAVLQVAHQYFALPRSPRLQPQVADAQQFLQQADAAQAHLIIADLYQASGLDPLVLQSDFLDACQRHLQADGWLVLNLWKEHREQTDCLARLQQRFRTLMHTTTHDGNWILWASNALPCDKKTAQQRSRACAPLLQFNPWPALKGFYRQG